MVIKKKTFLMFIISSFVILTISTNFKKIYTLIYAHNPEINYGDLKSRVNVSFAYFVFPWCDHLNEISLAALFHGMICLSTFYKMKS